MALLNQFLTGGQHIVCIPLYPHICSTILLQWLCSCPNIQVSWPFHGCIPLFHSSAITVHSMIRAAAEVPPSWWYLTKGYKRKITMLFVYHQENHHGYLALNYHNVFSINPNFIMPFFGLKNISLQLDHQKWSRQLGQLDLGSTMVYELFVGSSWT